MSEHQRETAFLRQIIRYDNTAARHGLEAKMAEVERNERCVRGAVWLMALSTAIAAVGLGYSFVFLGDFPENKSQFILKVFAGLGIGSLICLPVFVVFWLIHRRKLDEQREACRAMITKLLESRLGSPQVRDRSKPPVNLTAPKNGVASSPTT